MDRLTPVAPPSATVYVSKIPLDLGLKDEDIFEILTEILKQFGTIE
jgi:hypothetical protein